MAKKQYIKVSLVARQTGVCIETIKYWARAGKYDYYITPGGHWRIDQESFSAFLEIRFAGRQ